MNRFLPIFSICLLLVSCDRSEPETPPESDLSHEAVPAPVSLKEETWVIETISTALARLAFFAGTKELPTEIEVSVSELSKDDGPAYRVTVAGLPGGEPIETSIRPSPHALSPTIYLDIAKEILNHAGQPSGTEDFQSGLLASLPSFNEEVLQAENEALSEFLTENPASGSAHQSAAFLLGTLALRENSGFLWNPLVACARATAHLALAEALETPSSEESILANLLIGLMLDTKVDNAEQIERLSLLTDENPGLEAWILAARFRNTRDWREDIPDDAPLLVLAEKYRALCEAVSTDAALSFIRSTEDTPMLVDWSRMALQVRYGVGTGHVFSDDAIGLELSWICPVLDRPFPEDDADIHSLVKVLNAPATPPVQQAGDGEVAVEVIDSAMWCALAQRHLCHAIHQVWNFQANRWGVRDAAEDFWDSATEHFSELEQFPLVALQRAKTQMQFEPYAERFDDLISRKPWLTPDVSWHQADEFRSLVPSLAERRSEWFSTPMLTGTAYRFEPRREFMKRSGNWAQVLDELHAIAPLQYQVVNAKVAFSELSRMSSEEIFGITGPLVDYHMQVIRNLSYKLHDNSPLQEDLLVNGARIDPNRYIDLARHYVKMRDYPKAAEAHQNMFDKATDRVLASNTCDWLVNYYHDNGETERALEISAAAAQVFSRRGLETHANLLEKTGRHDEAAVVFQSLADRYNDPALLAEFYRRVAARDPDSGYDAEVKKLEVSLFPDGVTKVEVSNFQGEPDKGVIFAENSSSLRRNGISPSAIIVAVEGVKVENVQQYLFIRDESSDPNFRLIVYQNGAYEEIQAYAEKRRFGISINNLE